MMEFTRINPVTAFTELRWITVETQPGHFPNR